MELDFGLENVRSVGQLVDGTCVRQSFVPGGPVLLAVSILLTFRSKSEEGYVYLDILEALSRKVLGTSTVPSDALDGEGWCLFEAEAEMDKSKRYEMMLRTLNCRAGLGPLVHCGDSRSGEYMFVGSKLARGAELTCRMGYKEKM